MSEAPHGTIHISTKRFHLHGFADQEAPQEDEQAQKHKYRKRLKANRHKRKK